jgi:hypothetical protein
MSISVNMEKEKNFMNWNRGNKFTQNRNKRNLVNMFKEKNMSYKAIIYWVTFAKLKNIPILACGMKICM